jgi:uncharacterized membrane protein
MNTTHFSSRPVVKIQMTTLDKALEVLGIAAIIALWLYVIISFSKLPEKVPMHYNFNGQPDRLGKKEALFLLPAITTALYALLTIVNRSPHRFNYLKKITPENAVSQYTQATRMIRYIKLALIILFFMIAFQTQQFAKGNKGTLAGWLFLAALGLVIFPVIYFFAKSLGKKEHRV